MKKLVVAIITAAVIAGGYYAWSSYNKPKSPQETIATGKVERGPLRMLVSSTGKVVSNLDVDIKCKASGEIIEIPLDVSDPVRKGELLIQLDPSEMQRMVDQAQASLTASQARLINAKESLTVAQQNLQTDKRRSDSALKVAQANEEDAQTKAGRIKDLLAKELASQEEYDTTQTATVQAIAALDQARVKIEELQTQERTHVQLRQQIRIAEAQLKNDLTALDLARERLNDTKVYSPIDGVVTARNVQIGQIISSGISNVGGGTTALTVSDLSRIFTLASVDEADIGKVVVDQPAEITVDAFPGKRFSGRVERIAIRGVNISNVVTFEVKIEVTSSDKGLLRPEMTANLDIIVAARDNVLSVPSDAIVRKEGKPHVTVVRASGEKEDRPVETGISDGQRVEVSTGVAVGETVVNYQGAGSKWTGSARPSGFMRVH
ncbi:MAG: efflux RND transporter periplasmic adaptor subunit [Syntrophales bacterium]|nr:efflux RND transporter periplasmic adaptor subunit [Syntrophales bacterium]